MRLDPPPLAPDIASLILQSGFNVVLQLPTSGGKTWRAGQAMHAACVAGFRAVYVTPTRALANELFCRWRAEWPSLAVGIFTGEYGSDNEVPVPYASAQVLIMTPERLDYCTRQWRTHWHWLPQVDVLVLDEVHLLGEPIRGPKLEGAVMRFRSLNPFARILALSATLGNGEQIADWLGAGFHRGTERVVPLKWRDVTYSRATDKERLLSALLAEDSRRQGTIVFVQSKRRAEQLANALRQQGIFAAHHHGGLSSSTRKDVEDRFRCGSLSVLVATATLEVGLNLPARTVVLYDIQQFDGATLRPLSVISAWQRAGRAGRLGLFDEGEVVVFRARWERAPRYEGACFEEVRSGVGQPVALAEQIVANVSARFARTVPELEAHMRGSFAAAQGHKLQVTTVVEEMVASDFLRVVSRVGATHQQLGSTELGRLCCRLQVSPSSLLQAKTALATSDAWSNFDLLLICCCLPECSPALHVDFEDLEPLATYLQATPSHQLRRLEAHSDCFFGIGGKRLLAGIKAALVIQAWTAQGNAAVVADKLMVHEGEVIQLRESSLRMLSALIGLQRAARTGPSSSRTALETQLINLELMVKHGVDEDLATLTLVPGIGQAWAKKLGDAGIEHLEHLAQAVATDLVQLGGLSSRRAQQWIDAATILIQADHYVAAVLPAPTLKTRARKGTSSLDPYRMRRSLSLVVTPTDNGKVFRVKGGADPHLVRQHVARLVCDCMDHQKGHLCKHLIAVRRFSKNPDILSADEELLGDGLDHGINLQRLWLT